jgi:hypothetical protein
VRANLQAPKIGDATLRAWFEKNRAKCSEPARLDFLEAVLVGDASDDTVNGFVAALVSGARPRARPRAGCARLQGPAARQHRRGEASGGGITAELEQSTVGTWRCAARQGWPARGAGSMR